MKNNLCAHVGVKKNLTEIAELDRKARLSLIGTRGALPPCQQNNRRIRSETMIVNNNYLDIINFKF